MPKESNKSIELLLLKAHRAESTRSEERKNYKSIWIDWIGPMEGMKVSNISGFSPHFWSNFQESLSRLNRFVLKTSRVMAHRIISSENHKNYDNRAVSIENLLKKGGNLENNGLRSEFRKQGVFWFVETRLQSFLGLFKTESDL